jgi:hypothetical protein
VRRPSSAIRRRIEQANSYLKEGPAVAAASPNLKLSSLKGVTPAMQGVMGVKHDALLQKTKDAAKMQTPSSSHSQFNKRRLLGDDVEEDDADLADAEDITSRRLPFTKQVNTPAKQKDAWGTPKAENVDEGTGGGAATSPVTEKKTEEVASAENKTKNSTSEEAGQGVETAASENGADEIAEGKNEEKTDAKATPAVPGGARARWV